MKYCLLAITIASSFSIHAHDIGHPHEHVEGGWNTSAGFVSDTDTKAQLWNPRGKSEAEVNERVAYLVPLLDAARVPEEEAKDLAFRAKFENAIYINSILPSAAGIVANTSEHYLNALERNKAAGVTMASSTVWAFPGSGDLDQTIIDSLKVIEKLNMIAVTGVDSIREAKSTDNMAVLFNTQGADFVIDDVKAGVQKAKDNNILIMNFVYNKNNALAGGGSAQDMGVTELGKDFIRQANEKGIVVDVSHSSNQTAIDAAKWSVKPILASHSNAYGVHSVSRNMTDEAILAVGETGGAVCSTGIGLFLNAEGDADPLRFVEHVVYTANLIGRDKTCFSTDYVHNYEDYLKQNLPKTEVYPPELGFGAPMANVTVEQGWAVARILQEDHGWSDAEIRGFLGENLMRVYAANWK
ncbi:membrane dipeptidase [Vibrio crassostreae]|nr:membrane dipeptidase [Vibrio crassostreae]CAK3041584.1 membrane dipeptidase [Vibrio crassostreae]CAK3042148.1 membrane dipeptidase [Vibrio crassostreae]CAK3044413.1 membrane dipeptidase [Vibrio crassostreae]CAK3044510.1 membrane dipeptidase [Vibrio crassostreae]